MVGVPPFPIVLLVCVTVLAFSVAGTFIHRRSDRPGASELSMLLLVCGAWSGLYALILSSTSEQEMTYLLRLMYVCIAVTPALWFAFATAFTGSRQLPFAGWVVAGGITVVHLSSVLLWPAVRATWVSIEVISIGELSALSTTKGPLYYVFFVYAYTMLLWGAAKLARHVMATRETSRYQHRLIVFALLVALVPNAVYHVNLLPTKFDPTPFAFTISTLLFVAADRRFQLFIVHPLARDVAREHVIEEMGDGVLVVDRSNVITDVNPALVEALDIPLRHLVGTQLSAAAPTLARQIDSRTEEQSNFHHAETDKTYNVKVTPFSRPGNDMGGNIITLHDVTAVRQREERLAVLNRILRHDIRNGLNIIDGYAELVVDDETDTEERQTSAERIKDRSEELLELAEKIRAIEKGLDHRGDRTRLQLMETLQQVTTRVNQDWQRASVSLSGPEQVDVLATSAAESLFYNLIENAAEHGGESPTISVAVTTGDEWAIISVSDDGSGIPQDEISAIKTGETPLHHTSGIGLWLVTWLVRQSGGTIDFDVDETGTTATVRLKLAPAEPTDADAQAESSDR
ncbi:histidine kinase N-terminal 7TM domain-containing protein [Haloferax sp. DFSO60]|uniref:histidine kinase N-terminal 7TM domain-containing protein n=1 Tax=Haloferax sp. DFSO60 TaxID=3388652 RepID=UPI00397DA44E